MSLYGMPLALTSLGDLLEVTAVAGGRAMQRRLGDLGVAVGQTLEVVQKGSGGQMVVAVGDARFALGQGMAQKILVTPSRKQGYARNGCEAKGPCRRRSCRRGWFR
ncbi:ferrous iron transport protein A [Aliiruegeria haliotis]|uniref:Ferrous iron transport protein A n=1 Tax=Aliiruegeria haliotis TaxID=1280846 RepID=A0A2T0RN44_9RHOB|nr:FeoA family protein [Aliiruegeria haliotis]PRY22578.1 ferrous iron transport protein A [Aliiruegeria haliotis]